MEKQRAQLFVDLNVRGAFVLSFYSYYIYITIAQEIYWMIEEISVGKPNRHSIIKGPTKLYCRVYSFCLLAIP